VTIIHIFLPEHKLTSVDRQVLRQACWLVGSQALSILLYQKAVKSTYRIFRFGMRSFILNDGYVTLKGGL